MNIRMSSVMNDITWQITAMTTEMSAEYVCEDKYVVT